MILKALYDYYNSLPDAAPRGAELKEIEYIIIIDEKGNFLRFESKRIDKKKCVSFLVPKGIGRTSKPVPNILWDNIKYVLGLEPQHKKCFDLFAAKIFEIEKAHPKNSSIKAVAAFYRKTDEERRRMLEKDPLFTEVSQNLAANLSFQLEGNPEILAEIKELLPEPDMDADSPEAVCLITGEKGPIVRLSTPTPLPGNSPMAAIVSFQTNSGYDSYGKTKAYNSPISPGAEFAYSTALKTMLGKDSKNKIKIGNRIFLFWGSGQEDIRNDVYSCFSSLLGDEPDKKADLSSKVTKALKLYKSIWSGEISTTLDDRFFILGLAPNVGRIAVVEWADMSLKEFAGKMLNHFEDMEIADYRKPEKRKPYSGIYAMLSNVTLGGKSTDSLPNLAEGILKAIISGTGYPYPLYTSALERIRAELSDITVTIGRAAILKAYINRDCKNKTNHKPLDKMLDKNNDNQGYLCGRLAAVLEKVQDSANSGDSIRTRYLAAASSTPSAVFPAMLNLTIHHSEKLNDGSRIFYEQLKQEIIGKMSAGGFPAHLDLNDQGRFFVGYYHQRADFYSKKDEQ